MKKLIYAFLFSFCFIPNVFADTIFTINTPSSEISYLTNTPYQYYEIYSHNGNGYSVSPTSCSTHLDCYNSIINQFNQTSFTYYSIYLIGSTNHIVMKAYFFNTIYDSIFQDVTTNPSDNFAYYLQEHYEQEVLEVFNTNGDYKMYRPYDTNYPFVSNGTYYFKNFYNNEGDNPNNYVTFTDGKPIPLIKDLITYSSWSDYESNFNTGYVEVNLDNYNYVILSLKNYNQTQSFQTNLEVIGQIGITPVYNYGQSSKDSVTGSKVQDRCNVNYSSYTSYPLYILQSDLQNNSVYYIKSCSSGSSFKYDSSIFDITFITSSNYENPTITISGRTYDVIPYDELPSTATENEEENYIPGESGSANDTGGLDSAIKNAQKKMSEIWNTITYFTDFIGQIFTSLPDEVRAILISGFTIMIVLGVIKIFLGK